MNRPAAILHTAPGSGGIAVIVLAGESDQQLRYLLSQFFVPRDSASEFIPGRLILGELRDGQDRLDEAVISFPASPGPCMCEINIHGGPRVTQRALQLLASVGARIDTKCFSDGFWTEHSSRAILREMLQALPQAHSRLALQWLTRQWSHGIAALARGALNPSSNITPAKLRMAADRLPIMQRLLTPAEVVLAGPPNAGKSSLANALLGRDACIVTEIAGTTRDWVRELADMRGRPVFLTDTAGLWQVKHELDLQAIRHAWERIDAAELVLAVCAADNPPNKNDNAWQQLIAQPNVIKVANKIDLAPSPDGFLPVSVEKSRGLERLRAEIVSRLGLGDIDPLSPVAFTSRQAVLLKTSADALQAGDLAAVQASLCGLLD